MEWTVVTVVIALVGLGATVIKPVISLTQTITKLTIVVDSLQKDMEAMTSKNSEGHARLWDHNKEQDRQLEDHEKRIVVIENK